MEHLSIIPKFPNQQHRAYANTTSIIRHKRDFLLFNTHNMALHTRSRLLTFFAARLTMMRAHVFALFWSVVTTITSSPEVIPMYSHSFVVHNITFQSVILCFVSVVNTITSVNAEFCMLIAVAFEFEGDEKMIATKPIGRERGKCTKSLCWHKITSSWFKAMADTKI